AATSVWIRCGWASHSPQIQRKESHLLLCGLRAPSNPSTKHTGISPTDGRRTDWRLLGSTAYDDPHRSQYGLTVSQQSNPRQPNRHLREDYHWLVYAPAQSAGWRHTVAVGTQPDYRQPSYGQSRPNIGKQR